MSMAQWRAFLRPCVYLFWKGDECVYVGRSFNGLLRPLNLTHPVNKQTDVIPDRLEFRWCESKEDAIYLEKLLLWDLCPCLNSPRLIAELNDSKGYWMTEKDRTKSSQDWDKERVKSS
jgi:hypothetical protein